jgi:RNA polymerase sigma-70 factor (ECF subfamily)
MKGSQSFAPIVTGALLNERQGEAGVMDRDLVELAHRILRDVDRAEDALQEALISAWRDLPGLREPDRFDAWLHRLVVRACIVEAKRERRRVFNLRVLPMDVATATDDFLKVAERDRLERGFRRLPPDQRALLALRHFEDRDPNEIAEILDIPVGTVHSRLHHAHNAMRAALDADARAVAVGGRSA